MWDPYADFRSFILPNGLTVHAAEWPDRPWQYMNVVVHSGNNLDPVGEEGLAHFVEHLVSSNTTHTEQEINGYAGRYGGYANLGVTSPHCTTYGFKCPARMRVFSHLVAVYSHMLMAAALNEGVEEQRRVILSEFEQKYANPLVYASDSDRNRAIFPGYRIARGPTGLGCRESITSLAQASAQRYYDSQYTPANMSIIALGGLSIGRVLTVLQRSAFGHSKPGERNPLPQPAIDHPRLLPFERITRYADLGLKVDGMKTWAVSADAIVPGHLPGFESARVTAITADILTTLLDRALTQALRERRSWTYHVGASYYDHGYFHEIGFKSRGLPIEIFPQFAGVLTDIRRRMRSDRASFGRLVNARLASVVMLDLPGGKVARRLTGEVAGTHRFTSLAEDCQLLRDLRFEQVQIMLDYLEPERWYLKYLMP